MNGYQSKSTDDCADIARRLMGMSDIEMANWLYNEVAGREAQGSRVYGQLRGLAASVLLGGWRPIDTAPKDGTVIDVWGDGRRCTDVHWSFSRDSSGKVVPSSFDCWAYEGNGVYPNGIGIKPNIALCGPKARGGRDEQ